MSQILTETFFGTLKPLDESAAGDGTAPKTLKLRGLFQREGVKNGNGRMYPEGLLHREVAALQEAIGARKVVMSLDHAANGQPSVGSRAAVLTKLWMEGRDVFGEAEVLDTSAGRDLRENIKKGLDVGVSSFGRGSTKNESVDGVDVELVQSDFKLNPKNPFDFVGEPSLASAGITSHVEEAKGGSKMIVKNLKELEENHPELAKALRAESRAEQATVLKDEFEAGAQKRVEEAVAKKAKEIEDKVRKDLKESAPGADETPNQGVGYFNLIQDILKLFAAAGFNPAQLANPNNAAALEGPAKQGVGSAPGAISGFQSAAMEAQKKSVDSLREQVLKLSSDLAKKDVDAFVNGELQKFPEPIRESIRAEMADCKTLEEAQKRVTRELAHIESVAKKLGIPLGKGRSSAPDPQPEGEKSLEENQIAEAARLIGKRE